MTDREPLDLGAVQRERQAGGLVCRHCGCRHFTVAYTRPRPDAIVRRRECRHCGAALFTTERAAGVTPV